MTRPADNEPVPSARWQPCPPGKFQVLARRLRGRRQRRVFLRGAAAGTAALAAGLVWWFGPRRAAEPTYGGLTCAEVRRLAAAYRQGRLGRDLREQVGRHLAECPRCRTDLGAGGLSG